MSRIDYWPDAKHRPPETVPELDSLSLLGNPWLDRDSETTDWLEERYGALRPSKGEHGQRTV